MPEAKPAWTPSRRSVCGTCSWQQEGGRTAITMCEGRILCRKLANKGSFARAPPPDRPLTKKNAMSLAVERMACPFCSLLCVRSERLSWFHRLVEGDAPEQSGVGLLPFRLGRMSRPIESSFPLCY
jgi:hypothetical protein